MIRIKTGPGFFRALFSRRSKRGRNGKLAKESSSPTHIADDVASVRSAVNQRTMVLVDKELEILGLLTDPRIPPSIGQSQGQNQIYQAAPQQSSTTSTLVIPGSGQSSQSYLKPQLHLQTESYDTLPAQRYEPITPISPLLPPPPSLWLPLQQPSPAVRPSSERGTAPTRVETEEPYAYMDTMTPLSPSPSHLTFATRSSGVFPCGFEPYAVDDGACPVSDRMSEDTVLVLPSPPRVVRAYGYARR
ncbi:hypothetical protein BJX66DRAFT_299112 [Aspergillus keveii]|uniref:Uncharacterized protein n=1 Tax=Aspergillus keveii TaxID=714993 RepID=A0ABR4GCF4_9EURO